MTHPFTDDVSGQPCELVIPPGGKVHPDAPGDPKIGVRHPSVPGEACIVLADLEIELDAFYCRLCQWNGRISGAWAADMIGAAKEGAAGG